MFDYLLTDEQKNLKQEVQNFVKSIPRKMILDMVPIRSSSQKKSIGRA
jgi:hypothetical protein